MPPAPPPSHSEEVDQRKLSVTTDTYTHVMADSREADYEELVAV
jgi:hypothetical protein